MTVELPTAALDTVLTKNARYSFLRGDDGRRTTRDDVVLYDAHPIPPRCIFAGPYAVEPSA